MQEKIGIFGGSFDPPHLGHKRLVCCAADKLSLTRVWIIPAGNPPHKTGVRLAPGKDRLELCRRTFGDIPQVEIIDWEIRRAGKSYTVQTLRQIRREYPQAELFLLLGADMLGSLHTWYCYEEILQIARVCVMARDEIPPNNAHLRQQAQQRIVYLEGKPLVISATQLRQRLAAGQDVDGYVTQEAAAYIREKGLYRDG